MKHIYISTLHIRKTIKIHSFICLHLLRNEVVNLHQKNSWHHYVQYVLNQNNKKILNQIFYNRTILPLDQNLFGKVQ